jgi:hypothetical protein
MGNSSGELSAETGGTRVTVKLSDQEIEILLKACGKYRQYIPTYIESRQAELALLDSITEKLSRRRTTKGQ